MGEMLQPLARLLRHTSDIFFIHIPKTAGTSVNHYYSSLLQPSQSHIEVDRVNNYANIHVQPAKFLSGHVRLYEYVRFIESQKRFRLATIVREPLQQLLSHIAWICHVSHPDNRSTFPNASQDVLRLGEELRRLDLNESASAINLVSNLSETGHRLLNNCQTRYLLNESEPLLIEQHHGEHAATTLNRFDVIGNQADVETFIVQTNQIAYLDSPNCPLLVSNKTPSRARIPEPTADVKRALRPLIAADQIVFRAALCRIERGKNRQP